MRTAGLGGGFSGFNQRTRRAEDIQKYPITLGLIKYSTVKNVTMALGLAVTMLIPGSHAQRLEMRDTPSQSPRILQLQESILANLDTTLGSRK